MKACSEFVASPAEYFAKVAAQVLDCSKPLGKVWTLSDANCLILLCVDILNETNSAPQAETLLRLANGVLLATSKRNTAGVKVRLDAIRLYALDLQDKPRKAAPPKKAA